jgi:hypothetical protein
MSELGVGYQADIALKQVAVLATFLLNTEVLCLIEGLVVDEL